MSLPAKRPECDDILRHHSNPLTTPNPVHSSANYLGRLISLEIKHNLYVSAYGATLHFIHYMYFTEILYSVHSIRTCKRRQH